MLRGAGKKQNVPLWSFLFFLLPSALQPKEENKDIYIEAYAERRSAIVNAYSETAPESHTCFVTSHVEHAAEMPAHTIAWDEYGARARWFHHIAVAKTIRVRRRKRVQLFLSLE